VKRLVSNRQKIARRGPEYFFDQLEDGSAEQYFPKRILLNKYSPVMFNEEGVLIFVLL
jgi:hypothetical protein